MTSVDKQLNFKHPVKKAKQANFSVQTKGLFYTYKQHCQIIFTIIDHCGKKHTQIRHDNVETC